MPEPRIPVAMGHRLWHHMGHKFNMHRFHRLILSLSLLWLLVATQPVHAADVLVNWHFAGTAALKADTNNAAFVSLWQGPAAAKLEQQVIDQLARQAHRLCFLPASAVDGRVKNAWRTELPGWFAVESAGEVYRSGTNIVGWQLAARLNDADHRQFHSDFLEIMKDWQGAAGKKSGQWTAPGEGGTAVQFGLERTSGWTVFSVGTEPLPKLALPSGKPSTNWFHAFADLPQMKSWWPVPPPFNRATLDVDLSAHGKSVRSAATLHFAENQNWRLEPWSVPTNTIHDPLISFTALQGASQWFASESWIGNWKPPVTPSQLYLWAMGNIPFHTFAALRVPDSTNALSKAIPALLSANPALAEKRLGELRVNTNGQGVIWQRLPILVPFLDPAPEPAGDYWVAGLFPPAPAPTPVPKELLAQFTSRTNLLMYDWEITQARLTQWQQLNPLLGMVTGQLPSSPQNGARTWLQSIQTNLGNAVTEATVTGPQSVAIQRKSTLGFTGYELQHLGGWIDSTNFPFAEAFLSSNPMMMPALPMPPAPGAPSK